MASDEEDQEGKFECPVCSRRYKWNRERNEIHANECLDLSIAGVSRELRSRSSGAAGDAGSSSNGPPAGDGMPPNQGGAGNGAGCNFQPAAIAAENSLSPAERSQVHDSRPIAPPGKQRKRASYWPSTEIERIHSHEHEGVAAASTTTHQPDHMRATSEIGNGKRRLVESVGGGSERSGVYIGGSWSDDEEPAKSPIIDSHEQIPPRGQSEVRHTIGTDDADMAAGAAAAPAEPRKVRRAETTSLSESWHPAPAAADATSSSSSSSSSAAAGASRLVGPPPAGDSGAPDSTDDDILDDATFNFLLDLAFVPFGGREAFEKRKGVTGAVEHRGRQLMYGSLYPAAVSLMFRRTGLDRNGLFVDVGSGIGQVVIQAALTRGCPSAGVEILPARHEAALELWNSLKEVLERQEVGVTSGADKAALALVRLGDVDLQCGCFSEHAEMLTGASVIFINNFGGWWNERGNSQNSLRVHGARHKSSSSNGAAAAKAGAGSISGGRSSGSSSGSSSSGKLDGGSDLGNGLIGYAGGTPDQALVAIMRNCRPGTKVVTLEPLVEAPLAWVSGWPPPPPPEPSFSFGASKRAVMAAQKAQKKAQAKAKEDLPDWKEFSPFVPPLEKYDAPVGETSWNFSTKNVTFHQYTVGAPWQCPKCTRINSVQTDDICPGCEAAMPRAGKVRRRLGAGSYSSW